MEKYSEGLRGNVFLPASPLEILLEADAGTVVEAVENEKKRQTFGLPLFLCVLI